MGGKGFQSSEEARAAVMKRWSKPRPVPVDDRIRTFPRNSDQDAYWISVGEKLGLISEDMSREKKRRTAYRIGTAKDRAIEKNQREIDRLKFELAKVFTERFELEARSDLSFIIPTENNPEKKGQTNG